MSEQGLVDMSSLSSRITAGDDTDLPMPICMLRLHNMCTARSNLHLDQTLLACLLLPTVLLGSLLDVCDMMHVSMLSFKAVG